MGRVYGQFFEWQVISARRGKRLSSPLCQIPKNPGPVRLLFGNKKETPSCRPLSLRRRGFSLVHPPGLEPGTH